MLSFFVAQVIGKICSVSEIVDVSQTKSSLEKLEHLCHLYVGTASLINNAFLKVEDGLGATVLAEESTQCLENIATTGIWVADPNKGPNYAETVPEEFRTTYISVFYMYNV